MRKKKLLFVALLLLIIVLPMSISLGKNKVSSPLKMIKLSSSASGVESGYSYHQRPIWANKIYYSAQEYLDKNPGADKRIPYFCVNTGACHQAGNSWFLHEAVKSGKHYHGYCLHIGKAAHETKSDGTAPTLTSHTYTDSFDAGIITNAAGNPINANQVKLLQALLASGYHYDINNVNTIDSIYNPIGPESIPVSTAINNAMSATARQIVAKQILVWEIVEGGRTSFDSYAPNVYNGGNSAYNLIVSTDSNKTDYISLETMYKAHIDAAKAYLNAQNNDQSSVFNKEYTMNWNSSAKAYTTGAISGLGKYSSCTSSNADVKVSVNTSNKTVTVSSTKSNQSATITCTYVVGDGSNKWTYYDFDNLDWQDIINGTAGSTFRKSFTVKSESSSVKVIKKNSKGANLSGSVFKLTKKDNSSNSSTLNGNGSAATLSQSGTYVLKETTVPHGYEAIPDTEITFDLNSKAISCTKQGKDSNNNVTCQNGKITVKFNTSNNTFEIIVVDIEQNFAINKTNASGQAIPGATFKVYTGNNFGIQVKFDHSGRDFTYNTNGSTTDVVDASQSSYQLKLLPKGIYKIVETAVPSPYIITTKEQDRTSYIKVEDNYVVYLCTNSSCSSKSRTVNNSITVKNYTTKVDVKKIGNGGATLEGVKFILYKEDKTTFIKSTVVSSGYNYQGTTTNLTEATVYVTNANGIITVNNLPAGTYYFKEIETIAPYVLPDGDDAFTKVTIEMLADGPRVNSKSSTLIEISNASKVFNFYKIDEQGNYLKGGKFKLQKYNEDLGKYEDIKVVSVTNDGSYPADADIFKEDATNGKVQFTLNKGIATFIEMAASTTYRVIELQAPKGFEIANVDNSAVIKLDRNGYAKGSATIINQKKSLEGSTAQAELIIEIQTGQTVVKYGLIIAGTLIIISGLMTALIYISKKRK